MLKKEDEEWLRESHPALVPSPSGLVGTIAFSAAYDPETHTFCILEDSANSTGSGAVLSGTFLIQITERVDKSLSALPALHVEGVDPVIDRHFNQTDLSACLCSPLEEHDFLFPDFELKVYLQQPPPTPANRLSPRWIAH